jgi:hypothetical protein
MDQMNWWLIGLAFVLGLSLTFVLTIRRVKREVPVSSPTGAAAAEPETAKIKTPTAEEAPTTTMPVAGTGAVGKTEKAESGSETNEDAGGD